MARPERAAIWLRVESKVSFPVSRRRQDRLQFKISDDPPITACLQAINTEPSISNSGETILTVTGEYVTRVEWLNVLAGITREEWPPGFVPGAPNDFLFDHYPPGLQAFADQASSEIRSAVSDAFGLILWRLGTSIDQESTISSDLTQWSMDQQTWHRLRLRPHYSGSLIPSVTLSPELGADLEAVALSEQTQPLGREIWQQSQRTDPMTAIVMCVMAVEIQTKRLIADLAPQAAWLISELPAPSVEKLVTEYLPKLSDVAAASPMPKSLIDDLKRAVTIRNGLVHRGPADGRWRVDPVWRERSERIAQAASDMLWLLDYYRGHVWALDNVSEATREAIDEQTS